MKDYSFPQEEAYNTCNFCEKEIEDDVEYCKECQDRRDKQKKLKDEWKPTASISKSVLVAMLWNFFDKFQKNKRRQFDNKDRVDPTIMEQMKCWFYLPRGLGDDQYPHFPVTHFLHNRPYETEEQYQWEEYGDFVEREDEPSPGKYCLSIEEFQGCQHIKIKNNDKALLFDVMFDDENDDYRLRSPLTEDKCQILFKVLMGAEETEEPKHDEYKTLKYYEYFLENFTHLTEEDFYEPDAPEIYF